VPARGDAELYSIDLATKAVTRLTNNSTNEFSPVWSPDGARVAYERYAGGHWDVWTKPAAPGGTAVNLTRDRFVDAFPDWQPLCHLGSPRAFGPEILDGSESGELVCGGSEADILSALGGNDSVFGNDGDDSLDGGEGNDVLAGGSGVDILVGGTGDDLINAVDGTPGDTIDAGGDAGDVCFADEGDIVSGCVVQPLLGGIAAAGGPVAPAHFLPARSF
jgi:Ca2+-binding RTX toxin-like protein